MYREQLQVTEQGGGGLNTSKTLQAQQAYRKLLQTEDGLHARFTDWYNLHAPVCRPVSSPTRLLHVQAVERGVIAFLAPPMSKQHAAPMHGVEASPIRVYGGAPCQATLWRGGGVPKKGGRGLPWHGRVQFVICKQFLIFSNFHKGLFVVP